MLVPEGDGMRLALAALPSASRSALAAWAAEQGARLGRSAILLDAALGLPNGCWPTGSERLAGGDRPWTLFARAAALPGFGRAAGERFFATLVPAEASARLPRRACEVLAGASSVFVTRPFQRNVQTGTHRIWKDLASGGEPRWANVWSFDAQTRVRGGPWLFEGYPSLLWARVFGERTRAPGRFAGVIERAAALGVNVTVSRARVREVSASPDLADAAVLALGAACLDRVGGLFTPLPGVAAEALAPGEGWIAGLAPDGNPPPRSRVVRA